MQLNERINSLTFERDISVIVGMKLSKVWLGYADALFLECGRLKKELIKGHLEGQVTFMLDCQWRVENKWTVAYGRDSTSKLISNRTKKIVGERVETVEAIGGIPELLITLQNGQVIRTFQSFKGPPNWLIGFNDLELLNIEPEWKSNDVSVWIKFEDRSYMRSYCLDDQAFKPKKFLKKYGL